MVVVVVGGSLLWVLFETPAQTTPRLRAQTRARNNHVQQSKAQKGCYPFTPPPSTPPLTTRLLLLLYFCVFCCFFSSIFFCKLLPKIFLFSFFAVLPKNPVVLFCLSHPSTAPPTLLLFTSPNNRTVKEMGGGVGEWDGGGVVCVCVCVCCLVRRSCSFFVSIFIFIFIFISCLVFILSFPHASSSSSSSPSSFLLWGGKGGGSWGGGEVGGRGKKRCHQTIAMGCFLKKFQDLWLWGFFCHLFFLLACLFVCLLFL